MDTATVDAFVADYLGATARSVPMAIASVNKSFTAFAVLQLVADGKVALVAPVPSSAYGSS